MIKTFFQIIPNQIFLDYTNEVDLVLTGDAEEAGDDSYYVTEGNFYSVSCQANGNPPAQVTITNADGVEIVVSCKII